MNQPFSSSAALDQRVASLPDDELAAIRTRALDHFRKRGLPVTREENWKYTDLGEVGRIAEDWLQAGVPAAPAAPTRLPDIDADWLVFRNGSFDQGASTLPAGVDVAALGQDDVTADFSLPLADLNLALLERGVVISVAEGERVDRPIGLLFADDTDTPLVSSARIHIRLARASSARFIEYHLSSGSAAHYANTWIDAELAEAAVCELVRIQARAPHHHQTGRFVARLGNGGHLQHFAVDLGGKLVRNDLDVDLQGKDSLAEFNGLYIASGKQHIDNHTRVDHRVGPAVSRQEYRGILTGHSRGVWNGKAVVHVGADGTDAEQANHNLLLSAHAEINAKPELEIYADEVKCSHGTTVGQLDPKALFYLRSRGLADAHARRVLTRAFATSVIGKSPIAEIAEHLGALVEQRLGDLAGDLPQ